MLYSPTSLLMFTANKGKYTIHGSYGKISSKFSKTGAEKSVSSGRRGLNSLTTTWGKSGPSGESTTSMENTDLYIYIYIHKTMQMMFHSVELCKIYTSRKTDLQEKKKWQLEIITLSPGHLAPYITGAHWWPSVSWNTAPQTQSKVPCCTSCT